MQRAAPSSALRRCIAGLSASAVFAVAALAVAPAAAATYSAGTLSAGQSFAFDSLAIGPGLAAPGAAFTDTVSFALTGPLGINSLVAFTDFPGTALISSPGVQIFRDGNPVALVSGINGPPAAGQLANTIQAAALSAGSYTLVISGSGSGSLGGFYGGTLTAVPALAVPDVPSWAGFLAGLALLGTLARRRASRYQTPSRAIARAWRPAARGAT